MKKYNIKECGVRFDKTAHTYTDQGGKMLQGITPIVSWIYPKTYEGIPDEVLAKAAEYGSAIHSQIEIYDEIGLVGGEAVHQYAAIKEEQQMRTIRNEYLVTDYGEFASSIDLVMMDKDEKIVLADIKTTSQLHLENVRLQLSIYAYMFELINPSYKVSRLGAMWLPKPQYGFPRWQEVERIDSDIIADLMMAYYNGEDAAPWREKIGGAVVKANDNTAVALAQMEEEIVRIEMACKKMKEESDKLRAGILQIMADTGGMEYDGSLVKITRKAAYTREDFDKKRFESEHPELYNQYLKTTNVKEQITIKIKKS